jgi:Thioesterase superfamily
VDVVGSIALITVCDRSGVSLSITTHYLAPLPGGSEVDVSARVVRRGRDVATIAVELRAAQGGCGCTSSCCVAGGRCCVAGECCCAAGQPNSCCAASQPNSCCAASQPNSCCAASQPNSCCAASQPNSCCGPAEVAATGVHVKKLVGSSDLSQFFAATGLALPPAQGQPGSTSSRL